MEWLRRGMKLGPVMLIAELAQFGIVLAASTIHPILVRRGISRLADLDVTGETMRKVPPVRYEHKVPGDLIHVDVKKIGRIPDGGGWRAHGRGTDAHRASKRGQRPGYVYLHTAIDDCSRLAYTEEQPSQGRDSRRGDGDEPARCWGAVTGQKVALDVDEDVDRGWGRRA